MVKLNLKQNCVKNNFQFQFIRNKRKVFNALFKNVEFKLFTLSVFFIIVQYLYVKLRRGVES